MADDLVERLEARCDHTEWDYLCVEAADRITALQAQNRKLVEALTDIARQKKTDELDTEYDVECADFEGGYDAIIDRARAAIAEAEKGEG